MSSFVSKREGLFPPQALEYVKSPLGIRLQQAFGLLLMQIRPLRLFEVIPRLLKCGERTTATSTIPDASGCLINSSTIAACSYVELLA
jgi:hypothetical protein